QTVLFILVRFHGNRVSQLHTTGGAARVDVHRDDAELGVIVLVAVDAGGAALFHLRADGQRVPVGADRDGESELRAGARVRRLDIGRLLPCGRRLGGRRGGTRRARGRRLRVGRYRRAAGQHEDKANDAPMLHAHLPAAAGPGWRARTRLVRLTRIVAAIDLFAARVEDARVLRQGHVRRTVLEAAPDHRDRVA